MNTYKQMNGMTRKEREKFSKSFDTEVLVIKKAGILVDRWKSGKKIYVDYCGRQLFGKVVKVTVNQENLAQSTFSIYPDDSFLTQEELKESNMIKESGIIESVPNYPIKYDRCLKWRYILMFDEEHELNQ